jgi:acetyltransferase-like isoleucine patch superfamily enzyme
MRKSKLMGSIPLEDEFKGLGALHSVVNRLLHAIARYLPMYPAWRVSLHRMRGVNIGEGVFIGSDVFIDNTYPERIFIEDNVTIISRTFIIGHTFTPIHLKYVLNKDEKTKSGVVLKEGCYIGGQSIIMPGVTIGRCSVIGAGSVVAKDIPDYSIAVGIPARVVRKFSEKDISLEM